MHELSQHADHQHSLIYHFDGFIFTEMEILISKMLAA